LIATTFYFSAIISDAKFRWDSLTGALNTGEIIVDVQAFIELFALFDSGVINNLDDGLWVSLAVTCDQ